MHHQLYHSMRQRAEDRDAQIRTLAGISLCRLLELLTATKRVDCMNNLLSMLQDDTSCVQFINI
jgi:hypothetical protein